MKKLLTCVLLIYFGAFIAAENEIPDIATLCPHSDFCKTEAKYWIDSGYTSCCQKCSCDPDCYVIGTCCPDALNNTEYIPSRPFYQCLDLHTILNVPRFIEPDARLEQSSYVIIYNCPDITTSNKYPRCESPTNLEDYVIVSDTKYEKNFKNRECALCHGVQDLIEWDLIAQCEDLMTEKFQSFADRDAFILKSCRLTARPPNRLVDEFSRCNSNNDLISRCPNFIENRAYYDTQKLRHACQETRFTQNTLVQDPTTKKIYSNIYCYLCNNPEEREGPGICPIDGDSTQQSNDVAFSAVIGETGVVRTKEDRLCEQTEIWDSFKAVCRKLHCPLGTISVDGACEDSVLYAEGFTLFVLFEIVVYEGTPAFSNDMLKKIEVHVDRLHGLDNFGCGACESQTFQYESTIFYRLPMYTTKNCSISTLLRSVRSLVMRNANIVLSCKSQNGWNRFALRFYTDEMPRIDIYHATGLDNKRCLVRPMQISLELLQDCQRFVIPIDELYPTSSNTSSRVSYLNPSGFVSVCTDTYFEMLGLSFSGVMSLHRVNRTVWTVLLIYVHLSLTI